MNHRGKGNPTIVGQRKGGGLDSITKKIRKEEMGWRQGKNRGLGEKVSIYYFHGEGKIDS